MPHIELPIRVILPDVMECWLPAWGDPDVRFTKLGGAAWFEKPVADWAVDNLTGFDEYTPHHRFDAARDAYYVDYPPSHEFHSQYPGGRQYMSPGHDVRTPEGVKHVYSIEDGWIWSHYPKEYAAVVGRDPDEIDELPSCLEERAAPPVASAELDAVNRHRRHLGLAPLDPQAAGWSEEDVRVEAERIRAPNPLRERLERS